MKNYKLFFIGVVLLVGGLAIGWLVKPNTSSLPVSTQEYSKDSAESTSAEEVWTCSMHPQIRQTQPGFCPICEMVLIPLENSITSDDPSILRMSTEAVKLAQIETFVVGSNAQVSDKNNIGNSSISVDGTVELDERTVKSQTVHLDGRIETMAVTFEGQYVKKGQKIASLYSTALLAASQELITAAQYNDRVEGLKDAAIQKLKIWKISTSQIAQILSSRQPIETIPIYADYAGYVLSKKLSQGDYVKQGQSLYTLGSTAKVWLVFNVFESGLANIKKGNEVKFSTPSIPNRIFYAKVSFINPMLNSQSRTALVRAEISNSKNQLKPGMLLNGEIQISKVKKVKGSTEAIFIPNSAILWTGNRSVVYVSVPDSEIPSYEFHEVEIGNRSGESTEINTGLKVGDEVVTQGAFAVDASAQLNNKLSMMNRSVKIKQNISSHLIPSFSEFTPVEFKIQLELSTSEYLTVKDALVNSDANAAVLATTEFIKSLKNINMSLLKGESHSFWMKQLKALQSHAGSIESAEDVEIQRNQFSFLSQAMINSIKAFGTNDKVYFVQNCPMAMNNDGADWLAIEGEIKNPYFGDKMMKCGTVKLEIN